MIVVHDSLPYKKGRAASDSSSPIAATSEFMGWGREKSTILEKCSS